MTVKFRVPAGQNSRFAKSVATSLIGTKTLFEGIEVPIVDAEVARDGSYLDLTVELPGERLPWPSQERTV